MKYVLVFCAALMLFSCTLSEPRSWEEVRCKGKIKNRRFYDKGGLFSIELPASSFAMVITEQVSNREFANIYFQDMMWILQVIVKKFDCPIKVAPNSTFKDIFNVSILQSYLEISPESKLVHEENIEGMYFTIYEVPGASRAINLGTGKRCTAIRASLIFIEEDLLVTLITDLNDYFISKIKDDPEMCYKMLKDELMKDRKSFKRSGSE
jgi:hypothetical protein